MDDPFEPAAFALEFQNFLIGFNALIPRAVTPFHTMLVEHLGIDPAEAPIVGDDLPNGELPNLQLALNELVGADQGRFVGLPPDIRHMGGFSIGSLTTGRMGGIEPGPVELADVPVGPDELLPCAQCALFFGWIEGVPFSLLIVTEDQRRGTNRLTLQATGRTLDEVRAVLRHLRERRAARNVYRGQVVRVRPNAAFAFVSVPEIRREDVVLPEEDLAAIEEHTIGISDQADLLRRTGRHLKRGLLLYGPPGTGKTYSVMYLCSRLAGRTVVLIDGPGVVALGPAIALARQLQPSMVVLEDVDLVAHERTMPGRDTQPLLFQLLNEMDGVGEDADVIFVLTTNRVELLEPAVAQRPGRIDQAVEVRLPDADCRRRLFERYLQGIDHHVTDLGELIARSDGVSAAFIKELTRRAVLRAGQEGELREHHVLEALADLRHHRAPIMQSALGSTPPGRTP